MNPSKDVPSDDFIEILEQWIFKSNEGQPQMGPIHLESHYKVHALKELDNLKVIMEGSMRNIEFLHSKPTRSVALFSTMNYLVVNPNLCSLIDWRSVISNLLALKVKIKVIIRICNSQSFNNLVFTFNGQNFNDKFSMEYGFFMASNQEVSLMPSSSSWMNKLFLMYAYLLRPQLDKNEILGSRHLPSSVSTYERVVPKDQKLYKLKFNLAAICFIV